MIEIISCVLRCIWNPNGVYIKNFQVTQSNYAVANFTVKYSVIYLNKRSEKVDIRKEGYFATIDLLIHSALNTPVYGVFSADPSWEIKV